MDAVFTLGTMGSPLPPLPRLHLQLQRCWELLLATSGWDEGLPVPVLDRSWLQLDILSIDALLGQFPVDSSAHAPELVRFQSLLEQGMPADEAEQLCWQDFGLRPAIGPCAASGKNNSSPAACGVLRTTSP